MNLTRKYGISSLSLMLGQEDLTVLRIRPSQIFVLASAKSYETLRRSFVLEMLWESAI